MADGVILMEDYVDKTVSIITNDGRQFVGKLRGFDQTTNLILVNGHERIYSNVGVEKIALDGVFITRGDNVAIVGIVETEIDDKIDYKNVKAEPLAPITH